MKTITGHFGKLWYESSAHNCSTMCPSSACPCLTPLPQGMLPLYLRAAHGSRKAKSTQRLHIKPSSLRTGSRTAAVTSSSSSFPPNRRKENWNTNQVSFYKINSFHLVLFSACFHSVITQKDTTYYMVLLISKPHSCTGRPAGSFERGNLNKVCSLIPRCLWSLFWFGVITWMSLWWGAGGSVRTCSFYSCKKLHQKVIFSLLNRKSLNRKLSHCYWIMMPKTQGKDLVFY